MSSDYTSLASAFEDRALDNTAFHHLDHVGVAYELLRKYDFIEATRRFAENLRIIATKAGAPQKFNATITFAYMSLIAERVSAADYADFDAFIAQNQDLLSKDFLKRWYSPERLQSELARTVFLFPDATMSA